MPQTERSNEFLESRTKVEFKRQLQPGAPEYITEEQLASGENSANYIIKKPYDIDYYYRKLPSTNYPTCENPGITSSICVPKDEVKD